MYVFQLIKIIVVVSGGWFSKKIELFCELFFIIVKFGNEYMIMVVFDIFEVIFEGMMDEVLLVKFFCLMEIILEL